MNANNLISSIEALGLTGNELVVSKQNSGIFPVFGSDPQSSMVKGPGGHYVFGRKNSRKYVLIEVNLANYPSIKQARDDAVKVSTLLERLRWVRDKRLESSESSVLIGIDRQAEFCYQANDSVTVGPVTSTGRLRLMTRGGVQALVLHV